MLFSQVWMARRATRFNLAKPQTFPLENPSGSNSGLRYSLVFWMSLYKDYKVRGSNIAILLDLFSMVDFPNFSIEGNKKTFSI